jgi:hypothetical protein
VKRIRSRTTDWVCGLCDATICPPCSKPDVAAPEARTLRTSLPNPDRSGCHAERRFGVRCGPAGWSSRASLSVAACGPFGWKKQMLKVCVNSPPVPIDAPNDNLPRAGPTGHLRAATRPDVDHHRTRFRLWDSSTRGRSRHGRCWRNRRSGVLGRRSRVAARPLGWSDLHRLLELADGPAPGQISIPEPLFGDTPPLGSLW